MWTSRDNYEGGFLLYQLFVMKKSTDLWNFLFREMSPSFAMLVAHSDRSFC